MSARTPHRQKARDLRNNMTEAEKRIWLELRKRRLQGHKFRRQQPLGPYIVDFVCLAKRLVVELDGGQHAKDNGRDRLRDHWLSEQGYTVLRFWNNEVIENTEGVVWRIADVLAHLPGNASTRTHTRSE